jgi:hypothetical protein
MIPYSLQRPKSLLGLRWNLLSLVSLSFIISTGCNSSAQSGMGNRKTIRDREEVSGCGEASDDSSSDEGGNGLRLNETNEGSEADQQSSPACETEPESKKPAKTNTSSSSSTGTSTGSSITLRTATTTSTSTGTSTGTEVVAKLFAAKCEGGPCHAAAGRGLENKTEAEINRALRRPVMRSVKVTADEVKMIESFLKKP